MNFSDALWNLRCGRAMRRKEWKEDHCDYVVHVIEPNGFQRLDLMHEGRPIHLSWRPTSVELFADDWEEAEDAPPART